MEPGPSPGLRPFLSPPGRGEGRALSVSAGLVPAIHDLLTAG